MHNNYYFLRQLSAKLQQSLLDFELITCFSQQKNELIIGFAKSADEFYIRAFLNPDFCCLSFPDNFQRAKKNTVELFTQLSGLKVTGLYQYENERSFSIFLGQEFDLLFKMHGNRSNILLFQNNELLGMFKNNLKKDREIIPQKLDRPIEKSFENFQNHQYQHQAIFPTFGKIVNQKIKEEGILYAEPVEKWDHLMKIHHQLMNPDYYLSQMDGKWIFSLLEIGKVESIVSDPMDALNAFFSTYIRDYYIGKEKREIIQKLQTIQSRTGNYIIKTRNQLAKISKGFRYEEKANIIMANLYNISPNAEEVELFDFYQNQPIKIKLKRDLSPQKNAEIYYRKYKNQKIEVEQLEENLAHKKKELSKIEEHLLHIEKIDDIRDLRKYKVNFISNVKRNQEESFPFRRFVIDDYEVYVGKNARSNDELTKKYAKKDDLWLHAKDVTGSHVILKAIPGRPFPHFVIEKAAKIAAYYSKRKNDTLCPVIFTPRKYIFKPKGASPGKVFVEREEVILVEPSKSTY